MRIYATNCGIITEKLIRKVVEGWDHAPV
jgi:hypothetical protein